MDDFALARIVHVATIVLWIGGVAFVTLIVMPSLRESERPENCLSAFHKIEGRFALQARIWVLLAGLSGFWMCWRADLWGRFADPNYWWMHAMLLVWVLFTMALFVIEPLFLHRRMKQSLRPAADFQRMERMHRFLLALSLLALIGAVGGGHGFF